MADEYNSSFTGLQIDTAIGKVGTSQLNTTAQNLSDAVNEVNSGKAGETIVATREISTTASKAYSVGEYLVLGGVLYEVIDDIASGGAIVVSGSGANVETTDVGSELNQLKNTLNTKADQDDLASLNLTGTTNTTGSKINAGTYFYLNSALVKALTDIDDGATFTDGTNYEAVTAGGLNTFVPKKFSCTYDSTYFENVDKNFYIKCGNVVQVHFVAQIKAAIPNSTPVITDLPNAIGGSTRIIPFVAADRYMNNATAFRAGTISNKITQNSLDSSYVGKWIMYSFIYICY